MGDKVYKGPARPAVHSVTHSPECHLWHPECAKVRVNALVLDLERLEDWAEQGFCGGVRQCDYCGYQWSAGTTPEHASTCPFIVLDQYMLRGVWKEEVGE
jgi:hypothetical protein